MKQRGMITREYYRCLGVSRDASSKEVKRAFRRLVKQHHPDLNPHDTDAGGRMRDIIAAYKVLSDPSQREQYNLFEDLFRPVSTRPTRPAYTYTERPPWRRKQTAPPWRRPPLAYLAALTTLTLMALVLWQRDVGWLPAFGQVHKWTADRQTIEGLHEVAYSDGLGVRPHWDATGMWELWFWQREYELNPSEITGRGLLRAYEEAAGSEGSDAAKPIGSARTTPRAPAR